MIENSHFGFILVHYVILNSKLILIITCFQVCVQVNFVIHYVVLSFVNKLNNYNQDLYEINNLGIQLAAWDLIYKEITYTKRKHLLKHTEF